MSFLSWASSAAAWIWALGGRVHAVAEVGAEGIGKQKGILRDVADGVAQSRLGGHSSIGHPVDEELPRPGLDQARHEAGLGWSCPSRRGR